MNLGSQKGLIAFVLVAILGAGGFLWYSQAYKPAVADRTAASGEVDAATQRLATAKTELEQASAKLEEANSAVAKPNDAVARLQLSRQLVPPRADIDDAAIVLVKHADRSGVDTEFDASDPTVNAATAPPAAGGGLQGATPIDIEFTGSGTYAEIQSFVSQVHSTVDSRRGKLYGTGRLFNVVSLCLACSDEEQDTPGILDAGPTSAGAAAVAAPTNEVTFTIVVRMYAATTDQAEAAGAAIDPAAAGTDATGAGTGAADASGAPTGSTPDPAATSPADPAAQGGVSAAPATTGAATS